MSNYYLSMMGKCEKNPSDLENIQTILLETAVKYKLKYHGLMRDIDPREITTAFACTFLMKCSSYEDAQSIHDTIMAELEQKKIYIHSSRIIPIE